MKRTITQYAVAVAVFALVLAPTMAFAITQPTVPPGVSGQTIKGSDIVRIINDVVQTLITISVIVAIGYFILGAINYATGQKFLAGDKGDGKSMMKNAVWGIALMLAIGLIINTVAGFINRGFNLG
ncbi:MAG: hypothetical protein IT405_00280 [Candidatus Yanofskybacteria bacterium]|nr:hypothetical protein [Candidatus Yanofskybacteria bacterium]